MLLKIVLCMYQGKFLNFALVKTIFILSIFCVCFGCLIQSCLSFSINIISYHIFFRQVLFLYIMYLEILHLYSLYKYGYYKCTYCQLNTFIVFISPNYSLWLLSLGYSSQLAVDLIIKVARHRVHLDFPCGSQVKQNFKILQ